MEDPVALHHDPPGADPDEDGGAAAAVVALDVHERVVADGPVLQRHHVDRGDVVPAELPVAGRDLVVLEVAVADRAPRGDGPSRGGALQAARADVQESTIINSNILRRMFRLDL